MLVQAQLEAGIGRQLKEHAKVLDRILTSTEQNEEEHRRFVEHQRYLDEHLDKLVSALGELIRRLPPPLGT